MQVSALATQINPFFYWKQDHGKCIKSKLHSSALTHMGLETVSCLTDTLLFHPPTKHLSGFHFGPLSKKIQSKTFITAYLH